MRSEMILCAQRCQTENSLKSEGALVRRKAKEKNLMCPLTFSVCLPTPLPGGHRWARALLVFCVSGPSLFTFYGQLLSEMV